jgi:ribosomal protein L11 methyltransferase
MDKRGMRKSWTGVEISCDEEAADELAAEVAEAFGVGVEVGDRYVRFYLEGVEFLKEWESKLNRLLDEIGRSLHPGRPFSYTTFQLQDEGWADRWKEHFKPLRIGSHFLICPTWEDVRPEAEDRVIMMDPGRAFGTGHHETTRLCLEWLEDWAGDRNAAASSLLDVGTGSGVLAMAAALLGFEEVLGIDNDPEAIEVAKENVALNRMTDRIVLREATVSGVGSCFDVVIANIQALPLMEMAGALSERLKDTGRLVLSGILVEQQEDVRAAFEKRGLKFSSGEVAGEWALLVFEKSRKDG